MQPIVDALRMRLVPIAGGLVGLLTIALIVAWLRGNHYRDNRNEWRDVAQLQRKAVTAAEKAAAARAEAVRIETENRYAEQARKADREEPASVVDQRAAADRYGDAHAGVRAPVHCGPSGGPAATAANGTAPDRDGPGADAVERFADEQTVTIPRTAFDQLRDNTLRLERVRIWGEELISAGLAAKFDEPAGRRGSRPSDQDLRAAFASGAVLDEVGLGVAITAGATAGGTRSRAKRPISTISN